MTTFWMITPRAKKSGAVSTTERYGSTPANTKSQYVAYMASIITAPWAKLMMRSTPKIRLSPQATSPYTPPSSRPLTTACSRSPQVTPGPRRAARLTLPLGHWEYRLGLGVLGGADDNRLAVLHLDERGRGVHVFARFVEADRRLGEAMVGEIGRAQVIGNALHQLIAHGLGESLHVIAHGRPEVTFLVHHGHALDGHVRVFGHLEHVAHGEGGHGLAVGLHAEGVLEPAFGQIVGHGGQEQEGCAVLLRHLPHGKCHEAREGTDDGHRAL